MAKRLKWLIVAGARPNFMKIAPLIREIEQYNASRKADDIKIIPFLVHTGQQKEWLAR